MLNRRNFIKTSFAIAGGATLPSIATAGTGSSAYGGIVYKKGDAGMWSKKVGSHAPVVSQEGDLITVETKHGMTQLFPALLFQREQGSAMPPVSATSMICG